MNAGIGFILILLPFIYIINHTVEHYRQLTIIKIWINRTFDTSLSEDEKAIAKDALSQIIAMDPKKLPLVKRFYSELFSDNS